MPEKRNQPFEETRLEESFECNAQGKYMDIGPIPFNEFSTQYLSALPYGQGDLNSNESIVDTSSRGTRDFCKTILILSIACRDTRNGNLHIVFELTRI